MPTRQSLTGVLASVAILAVTAEALAAQQPGPQERAAGQRRGPRTGAPGDRPGRPWGPPPIPVMTAIDGDRDGEISAGELAGAAEALKKLDANGDGKLGGDELRPRFRRPRGPGRPGAAGPGRRFGPGRAASFGSAPQPKDDAEKKILEAMAKIRREQGRRANVPDADGRLLRLLAEAIGAKRVVEIGTSNGISAIWLATALRKTGGKLVTHEIDAQTAALARENFARAGVADLVTVVEGDAHQTVSGLEGPIDLVFLDADKQGYLDYLEKLLPVVRPGGLVLAHNMNARMADPRFVKAITTNPNLETLFYVQGAGMGVTLKKR